MGGTIVYGLCAVTAIGCAWLLLRAFHNTRARLLLWSGICFALLAVNNALVIVDLKIVPASVDLFVFRNIATLLAIGVMLYGLIWDAR